MDYVVRLAEVAQTEAEDYVAFIHSRSHDPTAAEEWWAGLMDALHSLETIPARCSELKGLKSNRAIRRQLLYHSHRIIFRVDENSKTVYILRIYHSSRKPLTP